MNKFKKIAIGTVAAAAMLAPAAISTPTAEAATSHPCFASPIKDTRGPGLKNWRAYDPWCTGGGAPGKWWGPWRLTKGGAWIDAERHNSFN